MSVLGQIVISALMHTEMAESASGVDCSLLLPATTYQAGLVFIGYEGRIPLS